MVLVCMLTLGVTGIGATAHFGMSMHGAAAAITVANGDASATDLCLLHCLVVRDFSVSDGMLAVTAVVAAVVAVIAAMFTVQISAKILPPSAQGVRYGDPGLLLTVCKRE